MAQLLSGILLAASVAAQFLPLSGMALSGCVFCSWSLHCRCELPPSGSRRIHQHSILSHPAVATWPGGRHPVPDLSLADRHPVSGRVELLDARHRAHRWAALRAPLRQMVDLSDALGPDGMRPAGLAGRLDRDAGHDGRSRRLRWVCTIDGVDINYWYGLWHFAGMQRQMKKNIFHEAYWILYTIATVYSFIITICYWTVVHNPGTFRPFMLCAIFFPTIMITMDMHHNRVRKPVRITNCRWTHRHDGAHKTCSTRHANCSPNCVNDDGLDNDSGTDLLCPSCCLNINYSHLIVSSVCVAPNCVCVCVCLCMYVCLIV